MAESKPTPREPYFWIAAAALALRLGLIFFGHTFRFYNHNHNFSFGWEMGSIGRALAAGEGFSNPFGVATGPTAWEPPLYPTLIAGVFKVFGIYSLASAIVLLIINSIFSALTCIPIYLIGRRCFSERVAIWTAWLWALLPPVMAWSTRWVWETSMATFLLTVIFWLALVMEELEGVLPWLQFGLLWGIAALLNTSLLAFLPAAGFWVWWQRHRLGKKSAGGVALASIVFLLCIAPWTARNYRTFGKLFLIRDNFGAELRLGNGPGADGTWQQQLHPTQNAFELVRYRQMGETGYVAERRQQAMEYIRADYARFAGLCARRFFYYWGGVPHTAETLTRLLLRNSLYFLSSVLAFWGLTRALGRGRPGAWLFFWLILTYPLVYYVVFPHPRYRHPIEPEMGILIVYAVADKRERATAPL
jgi:4-amino-4-deoxy-L-arabinose transferase-like glycosyltransferase